MTTVQGVFARGQAIWAAHKIATFPIEEVIHGDKTRKKPLIKNYSYVGLKASAELARKFAHASALGIIAGQKSGIIALDVDVAGKRGEQVLADALIRHGRSNVIARTASGKFHALYKFNGERRHTRPWPGLEIDIVGAATPPKKASVLVVAPSEFTKGTYEIIEGNMDEVDRLTVAKGLRDDELQLQQSRYAGTGTQSGVLVPDGQRGDKLYRHLLRQANLMRQAGSCDLADLVAVAKTFNENHCVPPMEEKRMIETAESAWQCTQEGRNRMGRHGVYFLDDETEELLAIDIDVFALLGFLRSRNGPNAEFWCTDAIAANILCGGRPLSRERVSAARRRLIELGYLRQTKKAWKGSPALFKWAASK